MSAWWLALPGVVGYVCCAGLARRFLHVPNDDVCRCKTIGGFDGPYRVGPMCDSCRDDAKLVLAILWPVAFGWRVLNFAVTYALLRPLTATFRLCAGAPRKPNGPPGSAL